MTRLEIAVKMLVGMCPAIAEGAFPDAHRISKETMDDIAARLLGPDRRPLAYSALAWKLAGDLLEMASKDVEAAR
jgi:hypothetical protein